MTARSSVLKVQQDEEVMVLPELRVTWTNPGQCLGVAVYLLTHVEVYKGPVNPGRTGPLLRLSETIYTLIIIKKHLFLPSTRLQQYGFLSPNPQPRCSIQSTFATGFPTLRCCLTQALFVTPDPPCAHAQTHKQGNL